MPCRDVTRRDATRHATSLHPPLAQVSKNQRVEAAVNVALNLHVREGSGHILVFLTGRARGGRDSRRRHGDAIERAVRRVRRRRFKIPRGSHRIAILCMDASIVSFALGDGQYVSCPECVHAVLRATKREEQSPSSSRVRGHSSLLLSLSVSSWWLRAVRSLYIYTVSASTNLDDIRYVDDL